MRKNHGWWIFALGTLVPAAWLLATAEDPVGAGWIAVIAFGWLLIVWSIRRRQRAGLWFAHACRHCAAPMRVVPKKRLKPPPGAPKLPRDVWYCPRCGNLLR